jgi:hypothetical protein
MYEFNINKFGSILSAYNSSNKNPWLIIDFTMNIDLWFLNEYSLLKKFKTIELGHDYPIKNAFSSRNDFILLTESRNLYLWKYY